MAAQTEDTENILEVNLQQFTVIPNFHEIYWSSFTAQAAFNQAFSPPPSRRQSFIPTAKAPTTEEPSPTPESTQAAFEEAVAAAISESTPAPGDEETWKQEYEDQVKAWRVQSAEAREKAEKVRDQWEAKRAAEREEAAKRKAAGIPEPEPEAIPGPPNELASVTSSTVLVPSEEEDIHERPTEVKTEESTIIVSPIAGASGEPEAHVASSIISQPDTVDGSQKWEEVNSNTSSSYPSISFPEQSTPPLEHKQPHPHRHHQSRHEPTPAPSTATLSVFDSSLSTRTRLRAFASSLAINLLLPFVNGVMLGFGEIFAKRFVLGWLGWGSTATSVGIQQRSRFGARR
ncbi:hypothetical protein D9756_003363 [Leucocoprinus leucothites]|uniref:Uncharacterized protein n=1 Tax=Leucocoprinus leucothites TaxID=201217 RepID=A0A8H5LJU8_9AGAR|nr:hypothetical protein D9756_003363 [Leucoagaricus leucothites]